MSDQGSFGNRRKKPKPRERPVGFKDRDFVRESYPETAWSGRGSSSDNTTGGKTPIILAKPDAIDTPKQIASPVTEGIKLRSGFPSDGNSSTPGSPSAGSIMETAKSGRAETYKPYAAMSQSKYGLGKSPQAGDTMSNLKDRSSGMKKPIKMLDGSLHWSDAGTDELKDQTDFLVVGVLGMQGVGKSTILSFLAGNKPFENHKKYTFPLQTQDVKERAGHMTAGIDMFVTAEQMILLDAQPILSPSILEQCIYHERKISAEYNSSYNGVEMQSLQIATFFFSVCHIVLIVQDWSTDPNIFRFIQSAEMLKLSPPSQDSTGSDSEFTEFYPHVIFVQNKADSSLCEPSQIVEINNVISAIMKDSKLIHKGSFSLAKSQLFPTLNYCVSLPEEVNFFLFPEFSYEDVKKELTNGFNSDEHFANLPEYKGHPNISLIVSTFKNMILSMPRMPLTRHVLTERTWFYYASKTWDSLKKSPLMSEYNRLLS